MEEDILKCPHCGGESFFECCKVTRTKTGRLTKDGFDADDFPADYQDDTAEIFSYMCVECGYEWDSLDELLEEANTKQ